jgi:lipopolysaccharide/colanic/teichoic acid biosynthesis glycosyltransferase
MKRIFDFVVSFLGLLISSPLMVPVCILIWLQDYHSPFYIAPRVGEGEKPFRMIKLRSMIANADKSGVDSTSNNDNRITGVGRFVRRYKLDELSQLWNVFKGDMSFVGPRPNVKRETDLYSPEEKRLLSVRPGITDISSIVFSDEGDILKDSEDPDLKYNQVIRPWKSRLGLLYVDNHSLWLDVRLILLTAVAIVSKARALAGIQKILAELNADPQLRRIAARQEALIAYPPPGMQEIVTSRG